MSELFYDEATIQIRRSSENPLKMEKVEKQSQVELFGSEHLIEDLAIYGSPLLNAATGLLGILMTLPRQGTPRDIDRFRQKLLDAIGAFRQQGQYLDYHPNVIEKSCFVFCAAFDELILYTSWGEHSQWENKSLLSSVFSQRNGGEVFFVLLEKANLQASKLVDFIELQYVLLMLGFKGRYRNEDESKLHQIKSDAYTLIRRYRTESEFPVPQTPKLIKTELPWHLLSLDKLLVIVLFILMCTYGVSEYWYKNRSQQILQQFGNDYLSDFDHNGKVVDLFYLSSDADIGVKPSKKKDVISTQKDNLPSWDILLAAFNHPEDAKSMEKEVKQSGYEVLSRKTKHGVELYIRTKGDIQKINIFKNELDVRFGLNVMIKRVPK